MLWFLLEILLLFCLKVWTHEKANSTSNIQKLPLLPDRYLSGKTQRYMFCSVTADNLALHKPAYQSTTSWGGVASRAVDGDASTYWGQNSCSHTDPNVSEPGWLVVDLEGSTTVSGVTITNREDCCGMSLLSSASQFLGVKMYLYIFLRRRLVHVYHFQLKDWLILTSRLETHLMRQHMMDPASLQLHQYQELLVLEKLEPSYLMHQSLVDMWVSTWGTLEFWPSVNFKSSEGAVCVFLFLLTEWKGQKEILMKEGTIAPGKGFCALYIADIELFLSVDSSMKARLHLMMKPGLKLDWEWNIFLFIFTCNFAIWHLSLRQSSVIFLSGIQ